MGVVFYRRDPLVAYLCNLDLVNTMKINHLDSFIILDARAVMHHCYHIDKDPDAILTELGNTINTAEFAFSHFMERYMIPILEFARPYQILIAHDAGIVYRSILHPEYKQQKSRTEKDPEQRVIENQFFDMMKRFWAAIGCTQAKVDGVEADDIIAYFCEKLPGQKIVYTTDADLLQLISPTCQVMLKCEPQIEGQKNGVPYHLTSIAKSMLGDTSDNYGGVKGFGPAKFELLLNEFGEDGIQELEECVRTRNYSLIKEVLSDGPNKPLQMLLDNTDQWELGYALAQLHPELCWKPRGKKITRIEWYKRVPSVPAIEKILNAMGCPRFIPQFREYGAVEWAVTASDINEEFYNDFAESCADSDIVSFDYEGYPSELALLKSPKGEDFVDTMEMQISGVSFNFGDNLQNTIYVPVNHKDADNVPKSVIRKMLEIAQDKSELAVQNMAFEVAVTKTNLDLWLDALYDTQLMSSYVDENESAGLKGMSKRMLNYNQASFAETVTCPETGRMRTMDELTLPEVLSYGCDDSLVTSHLFIQMRIIMLLEGSWEFFKENETCAVHSLVDGYLTGCEVDWDVLKDQTAKDKAIIKESTDELRGLLEEHCSEVNVAAATAYAEEEKQYIRLLAKKKAKEKLGKAETVSYNSETFTVAEMSDEEKGAYIAHAMATAYSDFRSNAVAASQYIPYREWIEAPEFKPTITQLNHLIESLGFDHPLEKTSRVAITDWLTEANNFDIDHNATAEEYTVTQKKFIRLFGEAAHQLNKREGEEYEAFIKFCGENFTKDGKQCSEGDELNTGAPKQIAHLLYCKLGLPVRLKNMAVKSKVRTELGVEGSPQTDALAVETALAEDTVEGDWKRQAMGCIQRIKESKTRISLYHDPYPLWKHPRDGRLHPQIRDCGTVTRRPTGTSPNILQVSKHQAKGVMRSIFVPYDGLIRNRDEVSL